MLGVERLRRTFERIINPQAFFERTEDERLEKIVGFRGQYLAHRDFQMALLAKLGLISSNTLLEIGCGSLTLGVPIIAHLDPGNYTGIDVRPLALNAAYRLVGKNELAAKNPRFVNSTTFGRSELGDTRYDFIVAFSVLYHLDDPLVDLLFREVACRLADRGRFIANINVEHEPSRWLEFPFQQKEISFYEELAQRNNLAVEVLGQGADLGMSNRDAASKNYYLAFRSNIGK